MSDDFMKDEIEIIPNLLRNFLTNLKNFDKSFTVDKFDEIWFTGSGDSHCASLYAASLFNQLDIPARAFVSMELSNFYYMSKKVRPCLVAISVSGKTPRVLELVKKFKTQYPSQPVIGLTDNPHSPLYQEATIKLLIGASPAETLVYNKDKNSIVKEYDGYQNPIPQTKTYFMNIVWLNYLAFFFKNSTTQYFDIVSNINKNFDSWLRKTEHWVSSNSISYPEKTIFVGSSLIKSLAQFGAYKWFEFTYPGLHQDIEEYAHTHYFTTESDTTILFFSPNEIHFNRIRELLDGALINLIKPEIFILFGNVFSKEELEKYKGQKVYQIPFKTINKNNLMLEVESYFYFMIISFWLMYFTARNEGFDTNRFRGGKDVDKYIKGSLLTIRKSKVNLS